MAQVLLQQYVILVVIWRQLISSYMAGLQLLLLDIATSYLFGFVLA